MMRVLLEKGYILANRVIDTLVAHFMRYRAVKQSPDPYQSHGQAFTNASDEEQDPTPGAPRRSPMPRVFHECLLTFVQKYKRHIVPEQKDELVRVATKQWHPKYSPLIKREIANSDLRDDLSVLDDL